MRCLLMVIALLAWGCSSPAVSREQGLVKSGKVCQGCAKDDFKAYEPCWKPGKNKDGTAKRVCLKCQAWRNGCSDKTDNCCCLHIDKCTCQPPQDPAPGPPTH